MISAEKKYLAEGCDVKASLDASQTPETARTRANTDDNEEQDILEKLASLKMELQNEERQYNLWYKKISCESKIALELSDEEFEKKTFLFTKKGGEALFDIQKIKRNIFDIKYKLNQYARLAKHQFDQALVDAYYKESNEYSPRIDDEEYDVIPPEPPSLPLTLENSLLLKSYVNQMNILLIQLLDDCSASNNSAFKTQNLYWSLNRLRELDKFSSTDAKLYLFVALLAISADCIEDLADFKNSIYEQLDFKEPRQSARCN
jgi:hypothetical protein